ncbi:MULTISPECIES: DUF7219 family protein [unclassified Nostoc]|uniref:Isopropylmalate/homocitrate/citramalate synthase n=1 Tax=Nostoc punctiforme NIES-2108 TaxID=1356359 RepID=A0A367R5V0_NOSPU|nr:MULTISPECIES: hypothetical protein [unclassified Nostoc]MBN3879245.1 hypothetical protein [Nostoc sp. JL23]MBN3889131.1 hypothetical protein [Nostoc sp. JL31]RCJ31868.1 hypothetical protein A6769_29595 [Nostoc punctiforme NIES-2108]
MTQPNSQDKNSFLYPRSRYYGKFQPENLMFNANLQEFSQKISYITCLETGGKLSQEEAYQQIKSLWKELKYSKKQLSIGGNTEI